MIISMEGNRLRVGINLRRIANKTSTLGIHTAPSADHTVCSLSGIHTGPSADRIVCIGFAGIHTAPSAGRTGHNKKRALKNGHRFPLARRTLGTALALVAVRLVFAFEASWHK